MVKRVLLAAVVLVSSVAAVYTLNMLDTIVHGTLYQYGLQFSYDWANPYWTLLRLMQAFLSVIMVAATVSLLLTLKARFSKRSSRSAVTQAPKAFAKAPVTTGGRGKPVITHTSPSRPSTTTTSSSAPQPERISISKPSSAPEPSAPTPALAPTRKRADTSGSFRCAHCGKTFTQPLRMLDFQGDRPRIVSICPFCNEIITSLPREEERVQIQDDMHQEDKGDYLSRTAMQ